MDTKWLCAVQDGINLFLDELADFLIENKDNKELSLSDFREEVRAITHEIKTAVGQRITDLYTRERFPDFEWARENWQRIKELG